MYAYQSLVNKNKAFFWLLVFALPAIAAAIIGLYGSKPNFVFVCILTIISSLLIFFLLTDIKIAFFVVLLLRPIADFEKNQQLTPQLNPQTTITSFASILSLIVVFTAIYYVFVNRIKIFGMPLSKPFLALLSVTFLSILFSPQIFESFQEWLRLLSFYLVYIVFAYSIKNNNDVKRLMTILLVSIIVPAIWALYQLFTGTGNLETTGFNRLMGTFVHPIQFAYYLLFVISILVVVALEAKKKIFIVVPAILGCIALSLLLYNTYTRAAWLGLVLVLLILGILRYRKLLLIIPVLLIVIAIFFSTGVSSRFYDLNTQQKAAGQRGNSIDSRFRTWSETYPLFVQSPVIGNGYGASKIITDDPTHNDYLKILAEAGILGLFAYLWLLFATLRFGWSTFVKRKSEFPKSIALVFFVLTIVFVIFSLDSNIFRNIALQWSFWGLAAATYKITIIERKMMQNKPVNNIALA